MVFAVQKLQAICHIQMAQNYNIPHLIHNFNIENDITIAVLAKDQEVNDTPKR